jgi:hypothetical protein
MYKKVTYKEAYKLCRLHKSCINDLKEEPLLLKTGAKLYRAQPKKRGYYYIIGYGGEQLEKALALL